MIILRIILVLLLMSVSTRNLHAINQTIPNGSLEVAYRQLQDGVLSESVQSLKLYCINNQCTLTLLTVNQCFKDENISFPIVETCNTNDGSLIISNVDNKSMVLEENRIDGTAIKYEFVFDTKKDAELSRISKTKQKLWFSRLTGFSGAVIKKSDIMNKFISWDSNVPTFNRIKIAGY